MVSIIGLDVIESMNYRDETKKISTLYSHLAVTQICVSIYASKMLGK